VLVAGGLLAAGLLFTVVRLFQAAPDPAHVSQGNAHTEAVESPATTGPAPAPEPATTPGSGPSDVQIRPVAGHQLEQPSPWEPALRGNKPAETTTTVTQALQPRPPANAAEKPASAGPASAEAAAAGLGSSAPKPAEAKEPAPADPAGPAPVPASPGPAAAPVAGSTAPKAAPKPPDPPAKPAAEPARSGSVSRDPAAETEAARKERLRKATGL
jgi:hypothetical protein